MSHPFLERAAQHLAQARKIQDEFEGKDMPAEAARQQEAHLAKASDYRRRVEREEELKANEGWMAEPQYKHDMTGRTGKEIDLSHPLLESERQDAAKAAFFDFVRKGEHMSPERKAALVEDTDGQKLLPTDFAGTILKDLPREAVIRGLAFVRPTSRRTVDVGSVNIAAGGWGKLELNDTAPDGLGSPPANKQTLTVWDLNALVLLGVDELDDSDDNLEDIIRQALTSKLAEQEDDAFAAGTGDAAKQPLGIAADTSVTQSITAAANSTVVADDLTKLQYQVPAWARRNGVYLGNSGVEQAVALLKNGNGEYIWRASVREGLPATLLGRPWYAVDGLPAMSGTAGAGTNKSLFFGDMKAGYMIADRRRFTVQRLAELYAAEGKVGLLFTHRVGGGVIRPKALASLLL